MLKARTMLLAGLLTLGGSVYAQSALRTTDFVPYIPPPGSGFELFLSVQHQSALQDMPEQTTTTVTAYTDDGVEIASRDFVLNRGERIFVTTQDLYTAETHDARAWAKVTYPPGVWVHGYVRDRATKFIGPMAQSESPVWLLNSQVFATTLAWLNPARNTVNRSYLRLFNPSGLSRLVLFSGKSVDGETTPTVLCHLRGGKG